MCRQNCFYAEYFSKTSIREYAQSKHSCIFIHERKEAGLVAINLCWAWGETSGTDWGR